MSRQRKSVRIYLRDPRQLNSGRGAAWSEDAMGTFVTGRIVRMERDKLITDRDEIGRSNILDIVVTQPIDYKALAVMLKMMVEHGYVGETFFSQPLVHHNQLRMMYYRNVDRDYVFEVRNILSSFNHPDAEWGIWHDNDGSLYVAGATKVVGWWQYGVRGYLLLFADNTYRLSVGEMRLAEEIEADAALLKQLDEAFN